MTDESGAVTAEPTRPRYVRPDDRTFCLRCWSAARLREARESAGRLSRLADPAGPHALAWAALGWFSLATAVAGIAVTAAVVIGLAWMRLGEVVLGGGLAD